MRGHRLGALLLALGLGVSAPGILAPAASAQIFGAVLPQVRSTIVNSARTAFGTVINAGPSAVTGCHPTIPSAVQAVLPFSYQTTDAGNNLTGTPNTPATVPAGGLQGFVFSINPTIIGQGSVGLEFVCDGPGGTLIHAPADLGVNEFSINSEATLGADVIPIALTPTSDGVIRIASAGATSFMATASVNIGPTTTLLVVPGNPRTTLSTLPATVTVQETDASGNFIGSPGQFLQLNFVQNVPRYFTVVVTANAQAGIPLAPDTTRIVLRFLNSTDLKIRGQASAAIVAPAPPGTTSPVGIYDVVSREKASDGTTNSLPGIFIAASATEGVYFTTAYNSTFTSYLQWVIPYTLTTTGTTLSGVAQKVFLDASGAERQDGSWAFSGTFTPLTGLNTAYSGIDGLGNAFAGADTENYSGLNLAPGTLADVTGNWLLQDSAALSSTDVNVGSVNITAQGVITGNYAIPGTSTLCPITGNVDDPPGKPDLLVISNIHITGAGCNGFNGRGYAIKRGTVGLIPTTFGGTTGDYYTIVIWDPALTTGGEVIHMRRL